MRINARLLFRVLGTLLVIMAVSMLLPIVVSVYYGDGSQFGLMLAAVCIVAMGLFMRNFLGHGASNELYARDGIWFTVIILDRRTSGGSATLSVHQLCAQFHRCRFRVLLWVHHYRLVGANRIGRFAAGIACLEKYFAMDWRFGIDSIRHRHFAATQRRGCPTL